MKRIVLVLLLIVLLCSLFGGCGFWMDGDYLSVKPNEAQAELTGDVIKEVTSYPQMRQALVDCVEECSEKCLVSIPSSSSAIVVYYIQTAINDVMNNTATGAYAVDDITYELGTNRGNTVIAFDISYLHSRADVLGMQKVRNTDEMISAVQDALKQADAYVVMRANSYEQIDIEQLVEEYANMHPDIVMEVPKVGVFVYPNKGSERIVEVTFTYLTDRETLRRMQDQVSAVFTSAELYVRETTNVMDTYSRLFSFLMKRSEYELGTSITPAYTLLHHGVGDSRAFANVYAALCRDAQLTSKVVSGTRDGEPWCWNVVRFRGVYYHVDLLRCNEEGKFTMRTAAEMTGYVWDYSAYPEKES